MAVTPYSRVPIRAAADRNLTASGLRVLIVIGRFVNQTGEGWPSMATIAALSGIDRKHIPAIIGQLERSGYLVRDRSLKPTGDNAVNVYRLQFGEGVSPTEGTGGVPPTGDARVTSPRDTVSPTEGTGGVPPTGDRSTKTLNTHGSTQVELDIDNGFETWWQQYPPGSRKVGKPKVREKYAKIIKAGAASPDELLSAVMIYGASRAVADGYACMPYRWLNEERWSAGTDAASPNNPIQQPSAMDVIRAQARGDE